MVQQSTNPFDFLDNQAGKLPYNGQSDLIKLLLYEIMRVKEIIAYYESIPNNAGTLGASILQELVTEAYKSLVDYDTTLMRKYYDLLQTCD